MNRTRSSLTLGLLLALGVPAAPALTWEAGSQPQWVFADRPQTVHQLIRNPHAAGVDQPVSLRLYQVAGAIAAPVPGWGRAHRLVIPGDRTVREELTLHLPAVKHPATFRVVWLDADQRVLGSTPLVVCPDDLLRPLRTLAGPAGVGVYGLPPGFAAQLRARGIPGVELAGAEALNRFSGRLVLAGSPAAPAESVPDFGRLLGREAKERGLGVVWLGTAGNPLMPGAPRVWSQPLGAATLVVAAGLPLGQLADAPEMQLQLVWLAELALASPENKHQLLTRFVTP